MFFFALFIGLTILALGNIISLIIGMGKTRFPKFPRFPVKDTQKTYFC